MSGVTHVMEFSEATGHLPFAGAEHHLFTLLRGQASAGLCVRLVMLVGDHGPLIAAKADELRRQGVEVEVLRSRRPPLKPARVVTRGLVVVPLVRVLARRRHDVVHTHLALASQLGRVAAFLARSEAVVDTTHNTEPDFARASWRLRLRLLDRITDRHIAISGAVRDHLVDAAGLDVGRIAVVRYGVEPPQSPLDGPAVRREHGIPPDRFVVGFVGRLTAQKNVALLLDALADLPDVHGVIAGAGELERELRAHAARVCPDNSQFLGYVPDGARLIGGLDVLCLPSRWEGLGLVLLEAMLRRVPVVACAVGAVPEVLEGGRCGSLVPPDDRAALAKAIDRLRSEPDLAQAYAEAAFEHVREAHGVEEMVRRTSAVYDRARRSHYHAR